MPISFLEPPEGDKTEKIGKLETILKAGLLRRRNREAQWRINIQFLRGRQWELATEAPVGTRRILFSPPNTKVKFTDNQIYPLARQAAAALVDNIAQPIASPATMEPADVLAAEIATDLLTFRQYEDLEAEKRQLETLWVMTCGLVERITYWDPDKASLLPIGRIVGAGEIETRMLNPWQFVLSPWATRAAQSEWICLTDVRSVEEINDIYRSEVTEEACAAVSGLNERDMMGLVEDAHGTGGFQAVKKAAILKRIYIRPDKKKPNGQVITWANGKLLAEVDLPEGEMPFMPLEWFPVPGSPYPLPFVSPLIDIQKEVNITLSQLVELKNRQLRGDLVVRGTQTPTEEWSPSTDFTDEATGRKTVYLDATVQDWKFLEYNLDPTNAERLMLRFYTDMMQISGIHESSLGMRQPSGTPATTTLALKESDLSGLTIFRHAFNYAHARIGRQKIILAKNHYKIPRINRIVGESDAVKVQAFVGADLRSCEDVRPMTTPMLTETEKNQIRASLISQMAYGPYAGPKDQLAKVRMIQSSGLPDAAGQAEKQCAPLSVEELEGIVGEIQANEAQLALIQVKTAIEQATLPPPEEQGGSELPPEVAMVMGAAGAQAA